MLVSLLAAVALSNLHVDVHLSPHVSFVPRPINSLFQLFKVTFESKVPQIGMYLHVLYLFKDFRYQGWKDDNLGDNAGVPLLTKVSGQQ